MVLVDILFILIFIMRFSEMTFAQLGQVLFYLESIYVVNIFWIVNLAGISLQLHWLKINISIYDLTLILSDHLLLLKLSVVTLRWTNKFSSSSCISTY